MSAALHLDGSSLKLDDFIAILAGEYDQVTVVKAPLQASEDADILLHKRLETSSEATENQLYELREYVQHDGELLPTEVGLLSLYLLLNQAVKHENQLSRAFLERLIELIKQKVIPCIHLANRSELSAMSELALILYGEEQLLCHHQGELRKVSDVFWELGLEPLPYISEDIAFITNLCCVSTAMSIYAVVEASRLTKTADICVAMQLEAIRGEIGAFDRRLHELGRPYSNQIKVAENIRKLIAESDFTTEKGREAFGGDVGPRCQDAISIRAVPQTHGGVRDTITWLEEHLGHNLNTISEKSNPLSGYLLDLCIVGLIDLGNMSERRSFRLLDPKMSYGLPMNLVGENPGFNHGFPVIHAAATAILAELKLLAIPNAAFSKFDAVTKAYKCTTFASALKCIHVISLVNKILAIEMYMAAQGMDLAKAKLADFKFGTGSAEALKTFRTYIDVMTVNRFASPDMVEAERIVQEGLVLRAVETRIGHLS